MRLKAISHQPKERLALAGLLSFDIPFMPEKLAVKLGKDTPWTLCRRQWSNYQVKLKQLEDWLHVNKIRFVIKGEADYPESLLDDPNPPLAIFVKGEFSVHQVRRSIGIVGTRQPTSYGMVQARVVSESLASLGVLIISGLAFGIDGLAHQAALAVKGWTGAVLPHGLEPVYPQSHYRLAESIVRQGGFLLSEFGWVQAPIRRWSFYRRNRIIAALSQALVVIEGGQKSGTLITASQAVNLGRVVYALPGRIDNPKAWAPNFLIQQGAEVITSVTELTQDILTYLGKTTHSGLPGKLDEVMQTIVNLLEKADHPLAVDKMVEVIGQPLEVILGKLTELEVIGLVSVDSSGKYYLNRV